MLASAGRLHRSGSRKAFLRLLFSLETYVFKHSENLIKELFQVLDDLTTFIIPNNITASTRQY